MKKKLRPLAKILLDAEKLVDEAIDSHDVQWGDLIFWMYGHLMIHRPDAQEVYVSDDSHPILYYGPRRKND